ncbi:MAG: hypothetical protein QOD31_2769, partial [Pseudonocardiales bacterium]|nr:hypothetical protein [Pseudonocardiales bacterium]
RGTSDHAAVYAQYVLGVRHRLTVGLGTPSIVSLYGAAPDVRDALVIGISQSGASPDIVAVVDAARTQGAPTIAITNEPGSALATAADRTIDLGAGPELAVAATKTYTAELLALYLLLCGGDADAVPDAAARTLAFGPQAYAAAERYRFTQRLVTTARGFSYPTAREAALKVMETSYLSAQAFSGADLLHGPLAMVDPDLPVIAIVTPGAGGAAMAPVVARLAESGANVLLVGPEGGLPVASAGIAEELLPILEILPLQQLAWRLALDRGGDPDRPRGLSKVTETW